MVNDAEEITAAYGEGYDALRSILLPDADELILLSYEQVGGEVTLLTITDGWKPDQSPDSSTSELALLITAREEITEAILNPDVGSTGASRFSVAGRTYRIIPGGITPPFKAPYQWRVVGQELRD